VSFPHGTALATQLVESFKSLGQRGFFNRGEDLGIAISTIVGTPRETPGGWEGDETRATASGRTVSEYGNETPEPGRPISSPPKEPLDDRAALNVDGIDRERLEMSRSQRNRRKDILDRLRLREVGGFQEQVGFRVQLQRFDSVGGGKVLRRRRAFVDEALQHLRLSGFQAERDFDLPRKPVS
jgi:hypothetical protein